MHVIKSKIFNLTSLIEGKPVLIKKFDETEGKYTGEVIEINPKDTHLIILEGYFIFKDENVRDLIILKYLVKLMMI